MYVRVFGDLLARYIDIFLSLFLLPFFKCIISAGNRGERAIETALPLLSEKRNWPHW